MTPRLIFIITLIMLVFAPEPNKAKLSQIPNLKGHPLQLSYLFGIKNKVPKKLGIIHQSLGIQHFMTPSGLHLSVFTALLFYIFKATTLRFFILLAIGFISLKFNHIDSLQRMIFFAALRYNPWVKFSSQRSFMIAFTLLFFQYFTNPMSYSLSFLFLGLILCKTPRLVKATFLIISQLMISYWFNQKFYFLGSLYGLFLTASSFIVFPLILIEYLFNAQWFTHQWELLLNFLYCLRGTQIFLPFSSLAPYLLTKGNRLRRLALGLGLFSTFSTIYYPRNSPFQSSPPRAFESMIHLKNGVKLLYSNGMKCYSRIKSDEWVTHCYK